MNIQNSTDYFFRFNSWLVVIKYVLLFLVLSSMVPCTLLCIPCSGGVGISEVVVLPFIMQYKYCPILYWTKQCEKHINSCAETDVSRNNCGTTNQFKFWLNKDDQKVKIQTFIQIYVTKITKQRSSRARVNVHELIISEK